MAKKKQTPTAAQAAAARGRMRARKATADSAKAVVASDKAALKQINVEIHGMVTSGAAQVRPNKLKELQEKGAVIATRMRGRRRAKKST